MPKRSTGSFWLTGKFVESGKEMDQMSDEIKRVKRELKFKMQNYRFLSGYNGDQWGSYRNLGFIKHKELLL